MSFRTLASALVLLHPWALSAQVDIESLRRDGTPPGISGSLGGDLTVRTGNTELVDLALSGRLGWVRARLTTLLIAEGGLGLLDDDRFSSSGLVHARQTLGGRGMAPEWYAQANYDRAQLLDARALAGAGVRLRLAEGARGTLGAGVSLMFERERLDVPPEASHPSRTDSWRNSTFVSFRLVGGEALVVTSTAYAQPALDDVLGDLRILENLRIAASLTERLALTVTFDLRYDSEPPDGLAALDTRLKTGVAFTY
jgi:hypothetical protein